MASSWGNSWSTFWGNSWGTIAAAEETSFYQHKVIDRKPKRRARKLETVFGGEHNWNRNNDKR